MASYGMAHCAWHIKAALQGVVHWRSSWMLLPDGVPGCCCGSVVTLTCGCGICWRCRYWLTGNTCNPSCILEDPLYPNCNRQQMGYCGDFAAERSEKYPEEFWTCSDVRIEA